MGPTQFIDHQIDRESRLDGAEAEEKARGFFFVLLTVYCAECVSLAIENLGHWSASTWIELAFAPLVLLFFAATGRRRPAAGAVFAILLFRLISTFPEGANHAYMLALIFGLFTLFDIRDPVERAWLIGTCKWILLVVLFYSGLQKLLHGYYANGEFFAYAIVEHDHFRKFFGLLLPTGEMERLTALELQRGQGPFRLHSTPGVLLSRAAYTSEMVLPFFLLYDRTRTLAVAATILMIAAIQAAAREFSFGLQFVNLTLLFAPGALNARLKWVFAAAGLSMVLIRLLELAGLIPEVIFL